MHTPQTSRRWRAVVGVAAAGLLLGGGATLTADAQTPGLQSEPLEFVALAPDRILDTRTGIGAVSPGKVGAGEAIQLDVAGRTLSNGVIIPTNARAVMVNTTSTEADAPTFLTFWPSGLTRPNASTLNAVFGSNSSGLGSENVPNMVTVTLGSNGDVAIFNLAGNTHVLADIAGYYIPAGSGGGGGASGDPITGGPTDPTGPCSDGDVYLNTTTGQLFSCVNGAWVPGANITGPAGPQGPAGAAGAPGDLPTPGGPTVITPGTGTTFVTINTFTAPVAGDYYLDSAVDAQFVNTNPILGIGLLGEVECRWNGTGVTTTTFGESLTAGATVLGIITVPGADRGAFPVSAQAIGLAAGATVTLQCRANVTLSLGTTVNIQAVAAGMQVS